MVNTAANVVLACGVVIALLAYWNTQRTDQLQRTIEFLKLTFAEDEYQRRAMLTKYRDRYAIVIDDAKKFSQADADRFFKEVALDPNDKDHSRYNAVRKHLNSFSPLAFMYVTGIGDRQILAKASCVSMTKAFTYFENLIKAFSALGPAQSWQVIGEAVNDMNCRFPDECKPAPVDTTRWQCGYDSYDLPAPTL